MTTKPVSTSTLFRSGLVDAAFAMASGCQSAAPGPKPAGSRGLKLAFVTNNASEFWKLAANGIHKYEAENKIQVDIKMPQNGQTEEQNQIIENLVSQGYDSIAVSVVAPKDQTALLDRAAQKTRLITFDSDAVTSQTS